MTKGKNSLNNSLEDWMEMFQTETAAKNILRSPEIIPFTKPSNSQTQKLYRAIFIKNRKINNIKSDNSIIAFSTRLEGALEFINSLQIMGKWVIIEKDFHPSDFLLDFSALYQAYSTEAYINEYEIWMKPTPYYSSVNKDEIVLTS